MMYSQTSNVLEKFQNKLKEMTRDDSEDEKDDKQEADNFENSKQNSSIDVDEIGKGTYRQQQHMEIISSGSPTRVDNPSQKTILASDLQTPLKPTKAFSTLSPIFKNGQSDFTSDLKGSQQLKAEMLQST